MPVPSHRDPDLPATGADAILAALEADGVDVVFGLPGGAALPLYDALAKGTTLRHVLARHEQGAGHMAEGYARASGRVGVAFATSGPGATNLVTPIADAWADSVPLVCITGQVASPAIGTRAFQETDIVSVVRPITKAAWQVRDPLRLAATVRDALRLARTGRHGPVLVDVPKDVQLFTAPLRDLLQGLAEEPEPPAWRPLDVRAVERAARLLAEAERPVLLVGGGVVAAGAAAEVLELAEAAQAPVVTTMMAKGAFPETHPLHAGIPGMHGTKTAAWALDAADLVVGIGTRFDDRATGRHDGFAPRARVVHLDVDAEEIDRLVASDVGLAAPLRPALQALLAALRPHLDGAPRLATWHAQLAGWHEAFPLRYEPGAADELKPQAVLEALRDRTAGRDDVVFTTGVGQHQMWAMQYLVCTGPRQFLSSGGLGTMGFGLPAAVGVRAARADATVVCVDGDGSFAMTAQELATAVAEDLPVVVVVINNGWLGMVRQWQDRFHGGRRSESHLGHAGPELAALARAYGCDAATVETLDELGPALDAALAAGRPFVLDCRCVPTEACYPMLPPGAAGREVVELVDVEPLPTATAWSPR